MELQPREPQRRLAALRAKQQKEEELKRWIISTRARLKSNPAALSSLGLGLGGLSRLPEEAMALERLEAVQEAEGVAVKTRFEQKRFKSLLETTQNSVAGFEQALDSQYDDFAINDALRRIREDELGSKAHRLLDRKRSLANRGSKPAFEFMMGRFDEQVRAATIIQQAYRKYRPKAVPPPTEDPLVLKRLSSTHAASVPGQKGSREPSREPSARYMRDAMEKGRAARLSGTGAELSEESRNKMTQWRMRMQSLVSNTRKLAEIGKMEADQLQEGPDSDLAQWAPQEGADQTHTQSGAWAPEQGDGGGAVGRDGEARDEMGQQAEEFIKTNYSDSDGEPVYDESMAVKEPPPPIDTSILLEGLGSAHTHDSALHSSKPSHNPASSRAAAPSSSAPPLAGESSTLSDVGLTLPPQFHASDGAGYAGDEEEGLGDIEENDLGIDSPPLSTRSTNEANREEGGARPESRLVSARRRRMSKGGTISSRRISVAGGVRAKPLTALRFATFKPMDKARRAMQGMGTYKKLERFRRFSQSLGAGDGGAESSSSYDTDHGESTHRSNLEEEQALLSDRLLYRDNLGLLRNIAGFAALGAGGDLGQAVQRQVALMVAKVQEEQGPLVHEQVSGHLQRIQDLINSAARLRAEHEDERKAILAALEAELERLRPVIDPSKTSQSGGSSPRRADVNWREQQRKKEEEEYQAAVDAAAAENEAISARYAAAHAAAEEAMRREEEEERAEAAAESEQSVQEEARMRMSTPQGRLPTPQGPALPPGTSSQAPPQDAHGSMAGAKAPPGSKRTRGAYHPPHRPPAKPTTVPSSPWARAQMRTRSRIARVPQGNAEPVRRKPLYRAPSKRRRSSTGYVMAQRMLQSTHSARARMRAAQSEAARELTRRKPQLPWSSVVLDEDAWEEGGRGVGSRLPYMMGGGRWGELPSLQFLLELGNDRREQDIVSLTPAVAPLAPRPRPPLPTASNQAPPAGSEPQSQPAPTAPRTHYTHLVSEPATHTHTTFKPSSTQHTQHAQQDTKHVRQQQPGTRAAPAAAAAGRAAQTKPPSSPPVYATKQYSVLVPRASSTGGSPGPSRSPTPLGVPASAAASASTHVTSHAALPTQATPGLPGQATQPGQDSAESAGSRAHSPAPMTPPTASAPSPAAAAAENGGAAPSQPNPASPTATPASAQSSDPTMKTTQAPVVGRSASASTAAAHKPPLPQPSTRPHSTPLNASTSKPAPHPSTHPTSTPSGTPAAKPPPPQHTPTRPPSTPSDTSPAKLPPLHPPTRPLSTPSGTPAAKPPPPQHTPASPHSTPLSNGPSPSNPATATTSKPASQPSTQPTTTTDASTASAGKQSPHITLPQPPSLPTVFHTSPTAATIPSPAHPQCTTPSSAPSSQQLPPAHLPPSSPHPPQHQHQQPQHHHHQQQQQQQQHGWHSGTLPPRPASQPAAPTQAPPPSPPRSSQHHHQPQQRHLHHLHQQQHHHDPHQQQQQQQHKNSTSPLTTTSSAAQPHMTQGHTSHATLGAWGERPSLPPPYQRYILPPNSAPTLTPPHAQYLPPHPGSAPTMPATAAASLSTPTHTAAPSSAPTTAPHVPTTPPESAAPVLTMQTAAHTEPATTAQHTAHTASAPTPQLPTQTTPTATASAPTTPLPAQTTPAAVTTTTPTQDRAHTAPCTASAAAQHAQGAQHAQHAQHMPDAAQGQSSPRWGASVWVTPDILRGLVQQSERKGQAHSRATTAGGGGGGGGEDAPQASAATAAHVFGPAEGAELLSKPMSAPTGGAAAGGLEGLTLAHAHHHPSLPPLSFPSRPATTSNTFGRSSNNATVASQQEHDELLASMKSPKLLESWRQKRRQALCAPLGASGSDAESKGTDTEGGAAVGGAGGAEESEGAIDNEAQRAQHTQRAQQRVKRTTAEFEAARRGDAAAAAAAAASRELYSACARQGDMARVRAQQARARASARELARLFSISAATSLYDTDTMAFQRLKDGTAAPTKLPPGSHTSPLPSTAPFLPNTALPPQAKPGPPSLQHSLTHPHTRPPFFHSAPNSPRFSSACIPHDTLQAHEPSPRGTHSPHRHHHHHQQHHPPTYHQALPPRPQTTANTTSYHNHDTPPPSYHHPTPHTQTPIPTDTAPLPDHTSLLPPLPQARTPTPTPRGPFPPQIPFVSPSSNQQQQQQHQQQSPAYPQQDHHSTPANASGAAQPHSQDPRAQQHTHSPAHRRKSNSPTRGGSSSASPPTSPPRVWVSKMRGPPPGLALAPQLSQEEPPRRRRSRKKQQLLQHQHQQQQQQQQRPQLAVHHHGNRKSPPTEPLPSPADLRSSQGPRPHGSALWYEPGCIRGSLKGGKQGISHVLPEKRLGVLPPLNS